MKTKYDFLVVGAGLSGATIARELADYGNSVLVIEQRSHVGGNCYTERVQNIDVHKYGAHIFRTNSKDIWNYVNRFSKMIPYNHKVIVNYNNQLYSFPINLMTLHQLHPEITTPSDVHKYFEENCGKYENPKNLEEQAINLVGEELFYIFIKGYTEKQWGKNCNELPASIIKRIPVRETANDSYFLNDKIYQGIPEEGYTYLIEQMLNSPKIDVIKNVNYLNEKQELEALVEDKNVPNIIYTGAIDEFFDYKFGELEWRSLYFEERTINKKFFQGTPVVNYTDWKVPYTRIIEHKHFMLRENQDMTIITYEYPEAYDGNNEKYYPVTTERNLEILDKYQQLIDSKKYIFAGRLAEYKYYDMDHVIENGIEIAKTLEFNV